MTEEMKQALDKAAKEHVENAYFGAVDKDAAKGDFMLGACWYRNNVWHDAKKEKPAADTDIAVMRHLSRGPYMSVCAMISKDTIYAPVARREYKWGSCPFTHWAYIEDLLPNEKI